MAFEKTIMQKVVRSVRDGILVHCYLACGHMLTMHQEDLKESGHSIECWACEEEKKGPST